MKSDTLFFRQRGVSLLEVLVTLIILSFGLLGIAGLITNSLKSNQGSYTRSQSSLLANDIIERMRANRNAAEASPSPYNLALAANPAGTSGPAIDLIEWRGALANSLPEGTGSVNIDAVTRKVTVIVQWNNSRIEGGVNNQQTIIETRL